MTEHEDLLEQVEFFSYLGHILTVDVEEKP